jgi:hypothetical protein
MVAASLTRPESLSVSLPLGFPGRIGEGRGGLASGPFGAAALAPLFLLAGPGLSVLARLAFAVLDCGWSAWTTGWAGGMFSRVCR